MGSLARFTLSRGADLSLWDSGQRPIKVSHIYPCLLGASAHSAVSICMHRAAQPVCKQEFREEPHATVAREAVSNSVRTHRMHARTHTHTCKHTARPCRLHLQFFGETILNGLYKNQTSQKYKYKISIRLA